MEHFYSLLKEGKFKVKYDNEWNNENVCVTHSVNYKAIPFETTHEESHIINDENHITQSVSVSVDIRSILNHIIELDCSDNELITLPELPNVQILNCSYN